MLSAIDPEPSMARMNAVRWFQSADRVVVFAPVVVVVAVEAVAHGHVERAVAVAVGVGRTAHRRAGVAPRRDGLFYLRHGRDVSQQRCVDPFGPAVGVVVVVDGKDPETVVHLFGRGQFAVVYGIEDGLDFAFGDILPGDVEPAAAAVVAFRRFSPVEHRAQRRHDEAVVESDAPFEGRRADDRLLVDVRRGVGVFLCDRVERIHGPEHS